MGLEMKRGEGGSSAVRLLLSLIRLTWGLLGGGIARRGLWWDVVMWNRNGG